MSQEVAGITQRIEDEIRTSEGRIDQDELIGDLTSEGFEEPMVLDGVRILMQRGKLSYDIDWNLQLED